MNNQKYILSTVALVLISIFSLAQNNTSSPYSAFGIGDLENVAYGRNLAIGGTGYGIRDSKYLNLKNPASLTSIDSLSMLFEMGTFIKLTQNSTNEYNNYYKDGNLSHLAMGHRFTPWLMGGFGIMPYSNIGYSFKTIKSIESENSPVVSQWKGTGGINKLFYSVGLKMGNYFSLGGEAAYLYGPINEERKSIAAVQSDSPTAYSTNSRYSAFSYKGAFQFNTNLGKKGTNLVLGGVFSPAQKLTGKSMVTIEQTYSSSTVITVYSDEDKATPIFMPMSYGGGGSFTWRGKYLVAADYEIFNWSANKPKEYIDQTIWSVGLERVPQNDRKFFKKCSYRMGFRYDSGYFMSKGKAIEDGRFTIGIGMPLRNSKSTVNFSLEAGQRGTTSLGLIRERYTKMSLAFSFHDYWFIKRRID